MKRRVSLLLVTAMALCGCAGESKAPNDQSAVPPAKPGVAPPAQTSTVAHPPVEPAVAGLPADSKAAPVPAQRPPADAPNETSDPSEYVSFPASGIKMQKPEGLEKSNSFDGFGDPETQSSVMAISLPGPYSKITAGFTKEQMKTRGWVLLSREDVKINGLPGILVNFEQTAGDEVFLKWSFVFGDEQKTTMVTAAFPKARERELSARLKSAVLSVRPDQAAPPDPGADLPFTLTASPKLKLSRGISRTIAYTKDGVFMIKAPGDPLFIATTSLGEVIVGDRQKFAEQRVLGTVHMKKAKVKASDAISLDGLNGFESVAEAEEEQSGTPLVLYQVVLFDDASYILMQGHVGTERRDEFMPEFKAIARSFRRRQP